MSVLACLALGLLIICLTGLFLHVFILFQAGQIAVFRKTDNALLQLSTQKLKYEMINNAEMQQKIYYALLLVFNQWLSYPTTIT